MPGGVMRRRDQFGLLGGVVLGFMLVETVDRWAVWLYERAEWWDARRG